MSGKNNAGGGQTPSANETKNNDQEPENLQKVVEEQGSVISALKDQIDKLTQLLEKAQKDFMKGFEKAEIKGSKSVEKAAQGDIELTKKALAKEIAEGKTCDIIISKGKKEPKGAFEVVSINGYRIKIQKGVRVRVPESVYLQLKPKLGLSESMEALDEFRLDRSDDIIEKLS